MKKALSVFLALILLLALVVPAAAVAEGDSAPAWSLQTLDGRTINQSTYADKTQLLVFYRATQLDDGSGMCGNSNNLISELAESGWIGAEDLQVIAVEVDNNDAATVSAYKETYAPNDQRIEFALQGRSVLWSFFDGSSLTLACCAIVQGGKLVRFWDGEYSASSCRTELEKATGRDAGQTGGNTATYLPVNVSSYRSSGAASLPKLSKEEIRLLLAANPLDMTDGDQNFDVLPSLTAPYAPGKVKDELLQRTADRLSALRRIAGLPGVELDEDLCENAQYGAVLVAASEFGHYPPRPDDMDEAFYEKGYEATSSSNLSGGRQLLSTPDGFMEDSGLNNVSALGHRRWQLNPALKYVGFGYATGSGSYDCYTTEKVFDRSGAVSDYDFISWPASGYFPNELFGRTTEWSITLNPNRYSVPTMQELSVTLRRASDGATWTFSGSESYAASSSGAYFNVNTVGYGIPNCIIFRPEGGEAYAGVYSVIVEGLKNSAGEAVEFAYQVEFFDAGAEGSGETPTPTPTPTLTPTPTPEPVSYTGATLTAEEAERYSAIINGLIKDGIAEANSYLTDFDGDGNYELFLIWLENTKDVLYMWKYRYQVWRGDKLVADQSFGYAESIRLCTDAYGRTRITEHIVDDGLDEAVYHFECLIRDGVWCSDRYLLHTPVDMENGYTKLPTEYSGPNGALSRQEYEAAIARIESYDVIRSFSIFEFQNNEDIPKLFHSAWDEIKAVLDPDAFAWKDGAPSLSETYWVLNTGATIASTHYVKMHADGTFDSLTMNMLEPQGTYQWRDGALWISGISYRWNGKAFHAEHDVDSWNGYANGGLYCTLSPTDGAMYWELYAKLGGKQETYVPAATASYGGHTYELYDVSLDWETAQAYCAAQGGYLVTITSQAEQTVVNSLLPGEKNLYWIGLKEDSGWAWVSGEPFSYANWATNEPTGGEERWAQLFGSDYGKYARGAWNDLRVSGSPSAAYYMLDKIGFICEYGEPAQPAPAPKVVLSPQKLTVDGIPVNCMKYNIDGSNYFKLRDLAQLLNGTGSQFDVGWDAVNKIVSITTNHAYTTPDGHELELGADQSATAVRSPQTITINGAVRSDLSVFNIGGSNFFKLRELGDALGFDVDYDQSTNTAIVMSVGVPEPEPASDAVDGIWYQRSGDRQIELWIGGDQYELAVRVGTSYAEYQNGTIAFSGDLVMLDGLARVLEWNDGKNEKEYREYFFETEDTITSQGKNEATLASRGTFSRAASESILPLVRDSFSERETERSAALRDANDCTAAGDYRNAIVTLRNAARTIGGDTGMEAQEAAYAEAYCKAVLTEAEIAFPEAGYQAAIDVIHAAQELISDPRLDAAVELYQSYAPVPLKDLRIIARNTHTYGNGLSRADRVTDGYGHEFVGDCYYADWRIAVENGWGPFYSSGYNVYLTDGAYRTLSGTIVLPEEQYSTILETDIRIIGDGRELYRSPTIGAGFLSLDFTVDITGVTELKVELGTGELSTVNFSYYLTPCLVNPVVSKLPVLPNPEPSQDETAPAPSTEWTSDVLSPLSGYTVEQKTQYRFRSRQTTSANTETLDGWTQYDKVSTLTEWGPWSDWKEGSMYVTPVNGEALEECENRTREVSRITYYDLYYYKYWNSSKNTYYFTYSSAMGGTKYTAKARADECTATKSYDGHQAYQYDGHTLWWIERAYDDVTFVNEYRTRERERITTWLFYRWDDWSDWTDGSAKPADGLEVETRTLYRYQPT